ncbi:uncharacterized protein PHACADRAFT_255669 [Phanerochaete carnosa HHB-10118-sp]|uniref:Uncharacterized protein n=1 Tax=Phanerochaete carnosa (strain HHB-10118-sp) TaxID=650164 RepID=K5UYJ0_PHACS|nr:uncharacterized protein PHACADRAFT_255669 [Phanerochaete carnosa HHB-10118-sp]EKM55216.1 hypothetical protein PHACADRAFT_255669 [Phanerochaete carnosa HHB-10118-sp]
MTMILEGYPMPVPKEGEEETFEIKKRHWEAPLVGVVNYLTAIMNASIAGTEDAVIVGNVTAKHRQILPVDVVARDIMKLLPTGEEANQRKSIVVKLVNVLWQVCSLAE